MSETALVLAGGEGWLFDASWLEGAAKVIVTGYIDEERQGRLAGRRDRLGLPQPV